VYRLGVINHLEYCGHTAVVNELKASYSVIDGWLPKVENFSNRIH